MNQIRKKNSNNLTHTSITKTPIDHSNVTMFKSSSEGNLSKLGSKGLDSFELDSIQWETTNKLNRSNVIDLRKKDTDIYKSLDGSSRDDCVLDITEEEFISNFEKKNPRNKLESSGTNVRIGKSKIKQIKNNTFKLSAKHRNTQTNQDDNAFIKTRTTVSFHSNKSIFEYEPEAPPNNQFNSNKLYTPKSQKTVIGIERINDKGNE